MKKREWDWQDDFTIREEQLPLVALRGMWIFPQMVMHFDVGRIPSVRAVEESVLKDSRIMLASQKDRMQEDPSFDDIYHFGTICEIKQIFKLPNGNTRVLVEGLERAEILELGDTHSFFDVKVRAYEVIEKDEDLSDEMVAIMRLVNEDMRKYIELSNDVPKEMLFSIIDIDEPQHLADLVVSYLNLKPDQMQSILETLDPYARLELVHQYLSHEIELATIEQKINAKVRKSISESQKEYYLREQLQAIKTELGEDANQDEEELEKYAEQIELLPIAEDSKVMLHKELKKLRYTPMGSPDSGVIRSYLDYVLDLPWGKTTRERVDIKYARKVLDEDHYGLKDVKERILEFIAVRKLKKEQKGVILCLVGPPGVGKTSIVRSMARALNRQFVSMRLGGVRDEAEIRGHRKTYVGAMPGRVLNLIEKAGTTNPVFLLDEVDKLGNDFRGDPSSALLEVLDPAQNNEFVDHYLEIPFDLSKVMFVTTANSLAQIPPALVDRMEVIEVAGYTEKEKFEIARRYLIPKKMQEHGLKPSKLSVSDSVIRTIIRSYTRESGVRDLERHIAKICRRAAKYIVETKANGVRVMDSNAVKYLDKPRVFDDDIPREDTVGVVIGLAWTQVGGEVLVIEVNTFAGKGNVQLTGSLGNVMKESAMAAITYMRAHSEEFGIDPEFFQTNDLHIHIPEGAVPKDGPSAGITMATALCSVLTGKKVRHDIAMTGEITLRGRVLPIGGLKEKALAANRYGIHELIIPAENERDLEDLPEEVLKTTKVHLVKDISQVLEIALVQA